MIRKKGHLTLGFKKGNAALDTITVIVSLLIFIIFTYCAKIMYDALNDDIQADPDFDSDAQALVAEQHGRYADIMDGGFLIAFILLWGLVMVASYQIDARPIFFVFTVVLMIAVFVVAAYIGNTYEDFAADSEVSAVAEDFPIAHYIMSHLLQAAVLIGFSVMIVLFGKSRGVI